MAGLVPAIHVFSLAPAKTWMPGKAGHDKFIWPAARIEHSGIRQR
jgi:hypothetical protein